MTGNETKMCRFCMYEEKSDNPNKVLGVFQGELDEDLAEKIKCYTQLKISPSDTIPPNICTSCVDCVVNFDKFLTCCWKSEKVLRKMYNLPDEVTKAEHSTSHTSNEIATYELYVKYNETQCPTENNERVASSDNDINSLKLEDGSDDDSDSDSEDTGMKRTVSKAFRINESMNEVIENNVYTCGICFKNFKSFFEYQDHQDTHNGQLVFSCTKCDQVFSERKLLVEHDASHKVSCQVCNKMVLPKSLAAHLKKHTDLYRCLQCSLTHTSKSSLETHVKARHAGEKGPVCHICGKQSSCQSSLNRHLAYHSSARPYRCSFCDFSTKSQAVLKVHVTRKHLAKQQTCEECGKVFKSEVSLKQHVSKMHRPRKHHCHICVKTFAEKYGLKQHILRKHSKQCTYECKVCNEVFSKTRDLKEHMHSHRQGCVSCPSCGKEFFYKKYLERHMVKCVSSTARREFEREAAPA
ncbi:hypothetical protein NQ315_016814 [Exocentrus adspersus]|uniref:Uncharacterized protein n=1 Tax=Exocentrus adspersus TaxID=1586481 RepID=A0AAV8VXW5_9CUCU|nr:hypothetical protein NQ315_016814 [Exocentrus adspersus]